MGRPKQQSWRSASKAAAKVARVSRRRWLRADRKQQRAARA